MTLDRSGSSRSASNHGPRLYLEPTAKILRVVSGSLMRTVFGPVRTTGPGLCQGGDISRSL